MDGDRGDFEKASVLQFKNSGEERRAVEFRDAEPGDGAVPAHEGARGPVADETMIPNGQVPVPGEPPRACAPQGTLLRTPFHTPECLALSIVLLTGPADHKFDGSNPGLYTRPQAGPGAGNVGPASAPSALRQRGIENGEQRRGGQLHTGRVPGVSSEVLLDERAHQDDL